MARGTLFTVGGLCALALTACSTTLPDFSADDVAGAVTDEVAQANTEPPDRIECGGLEPEVDATTQCTYVLGDRTQDADVTVTSVEDEDVEFVVEVTRTYLSPEQLTPLVADEMLAEGSVGEVSCLDPLDLDTGARVYCAQVIGETTTDLVITAQSGATEAIALEIEIDDRAASENGQ